MENELDLTKILKVEDKVYSTIGGDGVVLRLGHLIIVKDINGGMIEYTPTGKLFNDIGECILFPSKDQRDWSKFERPVEFKPGQLVLVRNIEDHKWSIRFFVKKNKEKLYPFYTSQWPKNTSGSSWKYCKAFDIEEYLKQQSEQ